MLCVNGTFVNTTLSFLLSGRSKKPSIIGTGMPVADDISNCHRISGYHLQVTAATGTIFSIPVLLRWRNALQAGLSSHEFRGGAGGQISAGQKRAFYPRRGSHRGNQSQNVFCVNHRLMPQGPGVMMAPKVPKWQFIGDALSATSVGDKITELWINNPKDFL